MEGKMTRKVWLSSAATLALSSFVLVACGEGDVRGMKSESSATSGKARGHSLKTQVAPRPYGSAKPATSSKDVARLPQPPVKAEEKRRYGTQPSRPSPDPRTQPRMDRERYQHVEQNPVKRVAEHPVSTFSVDVDTGAYANLRRFLTAGRMPPGDAVRVEELINYFTYKYPAPETRQRPFRVSTQITRTPWNRDTFLLHIGIKGYEVKRAQRPAANLVFLVDVSGSMYSPKKLPLLKAALAMLTDSLNDGDRVSLVVYAGATGVVLEPTSDKARIKAALEQLRAGGRTAGAAGIKLAYAMAEKAFIKGGINRVILATDGDFNVGVSNVQALKDMVARKRKTGITLTTLGFGTGNYNEHLMERIANVGNGNYAYIDTLNEARKVLVTEMNSTLFTIAKDVKVQIEFNPAIVGEYRLIGYENRKLKREDFRNDKVDAGDIGAGHRVTAIYEIALKGGKGLRLDKLRYGAKADEATGAKASEFAHLRLRYKAPEGAKSKLVEVPLVRSDIDRAAQGEVRPDENARFSSAVAAFGQILKGGTYTGSFGYDDVIRLAESAKGDDRFGYRAEFVNLVRLAKSLDGAPKPASNTAERQ